jgi:hypothetical protein
MFGIYAIGGWFLHLRRTIVAERFIAGGARLRRAHELGRSLGDAVTEYLSP